VFENEYYVPKVRFLGLKSKTCFAKSQVSEVKEKGVLLKLGRTPGYFVQYKLILEEDLS